MDKAAIASRIVGALHAKGFDALWAGGCVRDQLRGVEPKDYDIATSATPEQVAKLFPKTVPVGAQFGVMLVLEEGIPFEVATFRTEGGYQDGRHPTEVSFTNAEEDAQRRDFTVNGLFFDLRTRKVLDFVGGQEDLKRRRIRTIGDPKARFLEDHLRMLRAVRFAVQLDFEIEPDTFRVIQELADLIPKVSQERIREEFSKVLTSPHPERGIRLMDEAGLLNRVMPELEAMKGVEQPSEFHPEGDVFVHTLLLLKGLSNAPIELALGCLLHDIAKPATFARAEDRIRFHGHDKLGAEMTRTILKRLTYSNEQVDLVCALVADHLKFKDAMQMRVSTLKRFLGQKRFDLHLELHRLDCLASHGNLGNYNFCRSKIAEFGTALHPPGKWITGSDLIRLGFSPGPLFSKILREVEDAVLEGDVKSREDALKFLEAHFPREGKKA